MHRLIGERSSGTYASQAGEGLYLTSGSTEATDILGIDGDPIQGITSFSAGVCPIPEGYAPYNGGTYQAFGTDSCAE